MLKRNITLVDFVNLYMYTVVPRATTKKTIQCDIRTQKHYK